MYVPPNFAPGLIWLVVAILLFLVLREIILWYWKVNEMVALLKRNNELLEAVTKNTNQQAHLTQLTRIAEALAPQVEQQTPIDYLPPPPPQRNPLTR